MSKNYKWILVGLLSCAFFFHQADRALFGLLTIPIQRDLSLTDVEIGWINTVLSWTLAGMAMIAGPIGDRFSRKWVITLSLIAWSLMTVMMGFVGDWHIGAVVIPAFFVVMFFRSIATGVGESFYGPCYPPLIASYHKKTLSLALSIHQGSLYFGLLSSGLIVAWALGFLGTWRNVFIAFGLAGLLLGIAFIFILKDAVGGEGAAETSTPNHSESASCHGGEGAAETSAPNHSESASCHGGEGAAETSTPNHSESASCHGGEGAAVGNRNLLSGYKAFFTNPSAILAMSGFIAIVFVNNAYLFWAPKFMAQKFALSVGEAGAKTMLYHHLFAFAAIIAGGIVTDRFVGRYPRFRLGLQIVAMLLGAPAIAMIGYASVPAMMIVMTAIYGVFRGLFEVNTHASLFDVLAPEYRSTGVGIFTLCAFFFGGLSGVMMGTLSDRMGVKGVEVGFAILALSYVVGALLMAISFFFTFKRNRLH